MAVGRLTEREATRDDEYMLLALEQAREAALAGEVPVGAVVVCDGEVIAAARNRREEDASPAAHAEFLALMEASRLLGRWRLSDCTVYVTLEPCVMCAGLMHQARIDRCVWGAPDPKAGALGSLYDINADERLNHCFAVEGRVLEQESAALLRDFFKTRREENKCRPS
jgi:tRNA(adenine34) deaminase